MRKMFVFIVVAFLVVPVPSFAQSSSSPEMSIGDLIFAEDIADDSIEVLSTEETEISGYTHQEPVFRCLGELRLVGYYGSVFDPKDQDILQFEPMMMCSPQLHNDY